MNSTKFLEWVVKTRPKIGRSNKVYAILSVRVAAWHMKDYFLEFSQVLPSNSFYCRCSLMLERPNRNRKMERSIPPAGSIITVIGSIFVSLLQPVSILQSLASHKMTVAAYLGNQYSQVNTAPSYLLTL